jgi:hypothetical protein
MWKSIRRMIYCIAILAGLGIIAPSVARADNEDYNAYWQDQAESAQQEQMEAQRLQQDYNAYWQKQAERPDQHL